MNNEYITQTLARQRLDEAARYARSAHVRRAFARTPARWHFPRVTWQIRVPTRVTGAWR